MLFFFRIYIYYNLILWDAHKTSAFIIYMTKAKSSHSHTRLKLIRQNKCSLSFSQEPDKRNILKMENFIALPQSTDNGDSLQKC